MIVNFSSEWPKIPKLLLCNNKVQSSWYFQFLSVYVRKRKFSHFGLWNLSERALHSFKINFRDEEQDTEGRKTLFFNEKEASNNYRRIQDPKEDSCEETKATSTWWQWKWTVAEKKVEKRSSWKWQMSNLRKIKHKT